MSSDSDKELLKRLAEAYAFIYDLRKTAIFSGDARYVQRTEGIEEKIIQYRQQYSPLFQRYFNAARQNAEGEQLKQLTKDGEGKIVQGRQEAEKKEEAPPLAEPPKPKGARRRGLE